MMEADVCRALDLANVSQALTRLDDDEKGVISNDTPGGMQQMATISESGLYSLVLSSKKPSTKRFKKWLTAEVLPTLRKTGSYSMGDRDTSAMKAQTASLNAARNMLGEIRRTLGVREAANAAPSICAKVGIVVDASRSETLAQAEFDLSSADRKEG